MSKPIQQQLEELQRKLDSANALLAAYQGLTVPPGVNPMDEREFELSYGRLRDAFCVQQPHPVPDQMALVWRSDLMRLSHKFIQFRAYHGCKTMKNGAGDEDDDLEVPTFQVYANGVLMHDSLDDQEARRVFNKHAVPGQLAMLLQDGLVILNHIG